MYDIQSPLFKQIDEPWIALLMLGIFIFIASITAIIMLCLGWRRYRIHIQTNNKIVTKQMPIENRPPQTYEIQKMEVYVPPSEDDTAQQNIGEFHTRFRPEDGIQDMHQFHQRSNKAYF